MLVVIVHSFLFFILLLYLHFNFDLHLVVVFHLSMFFIYICFSTSSFTPPWTITGFLHPFYTFSPAHRRVICNTFIFNHSVIFLPRALRFWVGIFYPQAFFTLCSFTDILLVFIKASLEKFAGSHTDLRNTDSAYLFAWFTVIYIDPHIQNDSVLNSTKYYYGLLVVII